MSFFNQISQSQPQYAKRIFVKDSRFSTASDFQASLENEPIEIVYPLPTPVTYTLSASSLNSLLGVNNVWADAGDVEVRFLKQ